MQISFSRTPTIKAEYWDSPWKLHSDVLLAVSPLFRFPPRETQKKLQRNQAPLGEDIPGSG
jgi:hypothetical protein